MKARTLGRLDLPDEARDGVLLDLHSLARELGAKGSDLWRAVELAISESSPRVGSKVIFVAGGAGEREPLLVASALACGAARAGISVMLVDTGALDARIGLRELGAHAAGFAELVRGGAPGESFHESGIPHLVVVPAGRVRGGETAPPTEEAMREALDILRAHAELVLVPGSLWQGDEASLLVSLADVHLAVRSPLAAAEGAGEIPDFELPGVVTGGRAVMLGVIEADFETPRTAAGGASRRDALRAAFSARTPDTGSGAGDDFAPEKPAAGAAAAGYDDARRDEIREEAPAEPVAREELATPETEPEPAAPSADAGRAAGARAEGASVMWKGSAVKRGKVRGDGSRQGRGPALRAVLVAGAVVALAVAVAAVVWMHPELLGRGRPSHETGPPGEAQPGDAGVSGTTNPAPATTDTAGTGPAPGTPGAATSAPGTTSTPPAAPASTGPRFAVIVASFKVQSNAEKVADELRAEGHGPAVWQVDRPGMGRWFRVVADTLATKAMADSVARAFREAGTWHDAVVAECE